MLYSVLYNMLYNIFDLTYVILHMLYNTYYITYPELLYNIQVWLYNIQDGYIPHPNLPDDTCKRRGRPGPGNLKICPLTR